MAFARRRRVDRTRVAGPVQLNLPFREPLIGVAGELPAVDGVRSGRDPAERAIMRIGRRDLRSERGVILVGGRSGVSAARSSTLHGQTGWPILADPISGLRELPGAVAAADAILRSESFVADAHVPT